MALPVWMAFQGFPYETHENSLRMGLNFADVTPGGVFQDVVA